MENIYSECASVDKITIEEKGFPEHIFSGNKSSALYVGVLIKTKRKLLC